MTKPRNSVLYMFDPLQQPPSTPPRGSSPELSPSDKENDAPQGDLTLFFNRFYVSKREPETRVYTPKGKLVDIGDTPAPKRVLDMADHDGSDADGELSESDVEGCGVVSPPRIPLADLDLEHTPRPLGVGRPPKLSFCVSPSQDHQPIPACLAPAPLLGSPLSEMANTMFSATSSFVLPDSSPANVSKDSQPSPSPFPEINVCAPETPIEDSFDVSNANVQAEGLAAAAHLRPSSTLARLSPDDPRRTSVDLYSSFHLQLQSEEMSFDLLNDKISFFGHGHDSFWQGGDDALEFEEMSIPSVMKAKLEQLLPAVEISPGGAAPVFSPPSHAMQRVDPSARSPITETAINIPLPLSPVDSAPPSRNVTPPRLQASALDEPFEPPSPPTSPVVADEPSLLLESEPLPPPIPQAVPALRIFKKTFKTHRNTQSSSKPDEPSQPAGKPETSLKRRTSLAAIMAKPTAVTTQLVRAPIRGVQRPPASMQAAGGVVIGLPPQSSSSATAAASAASSGTVPGARSARANGSAAPVSRFAGIQRPNLAAKEKAAPRAALAARPSVRPAPTGVSKVTAPALRPPSRIAAPSSSSSALPKPSSRLPSAPGIMRTVSMTTASNGTLTTGAAARARSSTLSKATRF